MQRADKAEGSANVQVLQQGIPEKVQELDRAWKPAMPVRELRKIQLQAQQSHQQ